MVKPRRREGAFFDLDATKGCCAHERTAKNGRHTKRFFVKKIYLKNTTAVMVWVALVMDIYGQGNERDIFRKKGNIKHWKNTEIRWERQSSQSACNDHTRQ